MSAFQVYIKSQYNLTDTVRVTIVVDEGYNREDVIDAVCELMKDEPTFEVHNFKVAEDVFSVNVKASAVELIENVEGVKTVEITKTVNLTNDNQSELTLELEKNEETVTNDYASFYIVGGIVFVAVLILGMKKFIKH